MAKIIKKLLPFLVIALIIYLIYLAFFKGDKIITRFDREFTLKISDTAEVESEAFVKLIGIDDNTCKEADCEREGEKVAKIIIVNNHQINYVKLGTLAESEKTLAKINYTIKLIGIDNNEATLKLEKK